MIETDSIPTSSLRIEHENCFDLLPKLPPNSVDLIVTSPPYFMGKAYDRSKSRIDFRDEIRRLVPALKRVLKKGGSICWQVGYHIDAGTVYPLDYDIHQVMERHSTFQLRNRVVWTFGHGEHCSNRFSGRHETILWYTLGKPTNFDLDAVRVPQKYPGKTHYRGPNKGELSGNPLGKNPGDVWEIPNVKANHLEKTAHPCQFPVALAGRLVSALCPPGGVVLDPYMGSGTTGVAALMHGRSFIGCDLELSYVEIARSRLQSLEDGTLRVRADGPVYKPTGTTAVSRRPAHFRPHETLESWVEPS